MAEYTVLSDSKCKGAKTKTKLYALRDHATKGLYLRVMPNGSKMWLLRYWRNSKEQTMSLGDYPTVSLQAARLKAQDAHRTLDSGIDPVQAKRAEKTATMTFKDASDLWFDHWRKGKSPRHADYTKTRLEAGALPDLGSMTLASIESTDVVRTVKRITAPVMAQRTYQIIGQVFRYAVTHGYVKSNPARDIETSMILPDHTVTNHKRIDASDLPKLMQDIELYRGTTITRLAMLLMAHTFVRTSELIQAEWSEFDLDNGKWTIPAERMKMRTPHIVMLSTQALKIVKLIHSLTGQFALVFPGDRNKKKPMSNMTILGALGRMKYKGDMTGHGFRGLASTILHEHGWSHEHIELQLAHMPRNKVSAAYNHALYLEPRAKMLQWWSDYLENGGKAGKVLTFSKSA